MKWFKLEEKYPKNGEVVLIKNKSDYPKYYIVSAFYRPEINCWEFEEASGEQYACWFEDGIEG